jgi:haloalkane dehalogenase
MVTDLYPFKPHFFPIGEHKMHYLDEGEGDPVVMVHGNPTWSFFYRNLIHCLKSDFRAIAPDHLGMGLSDKPRNYPYNLHDHLDNFARLMDHLDLPPFHLVVHDWGGPIGLAYGVEHPRKIKSLTILNTAAFNSKRIPWRILLCKTPILGRFLIQGLNGFAWPATFMATEKTLSREIKKGYLLPYKTSGQRKAIWRFVQEIPLDKNHKNFDLIGNIEKNLKRLTCPKLILWGGKDFCFNDFFLSQWKILFPSAKVKIFHDAGHYVLEDASPHIEGEIKKFLEHP